ncbi:MAG: sigma-70 family RNA polymerase sigma factor [Planctomycetes bacterium]|nr:sigma-70 family RNA polymerase sigma factor [Planctomycetota bacterium]
MERDSTVDVSADLSRSTGGDGAAAARLMALVHGELRALAVEYFRRERPDHTLQPSALVNEAYLRLVDQDRTDWAGKTHFKAIAAIEMRRVLLDHARAHRAEKRGGAWRRVSLEGVLSPQGEPGVDALDVEEAIARLAALEPRQARMVELRVYSGLTVAEIARVLGISPKTVEKDWRMARAWLHRRLRRDRARRAEE